MSNTIRKNVGKKKVLSKKPIDMKTVKVVYCEHLTLIKRTDW